VSIIAVTNVQNKMLKTSVNAFMKTIKTRLKAFHATVQASRRKHQTVAKMTNVSQRWLVGLRQTGGEGSQDKVVFKTRLFYNSEKLHRFCKKPPIDGPLLKKG